MTDAPDPPIRKTVSLPTSLWKRVEDYQFQTRVKRDAEAIRRLIELGLSSAASTRAGVGVRVDATGASAGADAAGSGAPGRSGQKTT